MTSMMQRIFLYQALVVEDFCKNCVRVGVGSYAVCVWFEIGSVKKACANMSRRMHMMRC